MPGAEPCEAHSFKRIREGNTLFIPPHPVVEVPHHGLKVDQSARGRAFVNGFFKKLFRKGICIRGRAESEVEHFFHRDHSLPDPKKLLFGNIQSRKSIHQTGFLLQIVISRDRESGNFTDSQ